MMMFIVLLFNIYYIYYSSFWSRTLALDYTWIASRYGSIAASSLSSKQTVPSVSSSTVALCLPMKPLLNYTFCKQISRPVRSIVATRSPHHLPLLRSPTRDPTTPIFFFYCRCNSGLLLANVWKRFAKNCGVRPTDRVVFEFMGGGRF